MERSRLDALICEQEALPALTREEIEAVQLRKLNRLLMREKNRSGFYGDLPEHLSLLDELAELPFTTEADLSLHAPGMLLTSQSEISRILSDATSGTTGLPKRVFYTDEDLENTVRLYMAGLGELIFPGDAAMICFPFSGPNGLGELISEAVTRLGARPLKLGVFRSYGELAGCMDAERPAAYVGMPVPLLGLLRAGGRKSLRRALVSGDACPESVTRFCEELLGTKLFPHYGSREMGMAGAVTCPAHSGMHLRENHIIAEIVSPDGRPLPAGEEGELVITTIGMEALPLIRYRTGDFTRILPSPCPCGSETLRLGHIRRAPSVSDILPLDEALFAMPKVVDLHAQKKGDTLYIDALLTSEDDGSLLKAAREVFPEEEIKLRARLFTMEDRALYPAKRRIEL